ncbi:jg9950 [Pararge aegeria aegeria]|uniref:Jg9950 protein n=3 Tax=Pararge aegeria TaxID=116150 RepID=A0A8S4S7D5_9NEOP|nr:jg9950 [Pararge aegeria aegeria]
MSNVCCKELQGWCKSFTKTEIFLCVLQAIFFVVFVASLTFLILHLVVCSRSKQKNEILHPSRTETNNTDKNKEYEYSTDSIKDFIGIGTTSDQKYEFTQTIQTNNSDIAEVNKSLLKVTTAVDKGVTCTWKPSLQTKAPTHYYEYHSNMTTSVVENQNKQMTEVNINGINSIDFENEAGLEDNKLQEDLPDGAEINVTRQYFIIALVKIKPRAITFGCTLTIVSEYWTITVASCIEAIEEGDSLDSFVMMRGFKEQDQNIYPVAEVMIHPQYQGVNVTFDLAALKSEGRLVKEGNLVLKLPSLVDNFLEYFLITIGEALTVFGYGRFG